MNSKAAAPGSSDGAANIVRQQSPPVPGEGAATPASEQAKGEALRTVEEAVARAKRPSKPQAAKKVSSSAGGDRVGGSGKAQPAVPSFTPDDIALRAYFIAEKRRTLGLPGDEHQDWIEAEQQLIGEIRRGKKPRRGK